MPPHLLVERQALGSGLPLSSSAFAGSRSPFAARSSPPPSSGTLASSFSAAAAAFVSSSAIAGGGGGAAPPLSCSVQFGAGRKLTGAAAARFRCDVLRQTGFL